MWLEDKQPQALWHSRGGIARRPARGTALAATSRTTQDGPIAMTDKRTQQQAGRSNMEKDPADWVTGDEPMTGAQRSYLKTLSEEAHEPFDENLTKAEASRRIDELQARTGRGSGGERAAGSGRPGGAAAGDERPSDDTPMESFGRAVSETVAGSRATPDQQRPERDRDLDRDLDRTLNRDR